MEPRALRKGFLSTAWHSPWAPRLGKYGAAAAAHSPSGILSDAKGARTTLPSAAARASGGEGKGPGSSCGFSEEVTSGGAVLPPASPRPGPLSSFPIGQLRFAGGAGGRRSLARGSLGAGSAGLCVRVRVSWAAQGTLGFCCSWGPNVEGRVEAEGCPWQRCVAL